MVDDPRVSGRGRAVNFVNDDVIEVIMGDLVQSVSLGQRLDGREHILTVDLSRCADELAEVGDGGVREDLLEFLHRLIDDLLAVYEEKKPFRGGLAYCERCENSLAGTCR